MKRVIPFSAVGVAVGLWTTILPANAQVNVTQYHNDGKRSGLYIDSAFTQSAAANLTRDLSFNGTIEGNVYAQPLYIEGGPSGPMVIVVTESNNVYALNAVEWQHYLAAECGRSGAGTGSSLHGGRFNGDHRHACCRS